MLSYTSLGRKGAYRLDLRIPSVTTDLLNAHLLCFWWSYWSTFREHDLDLSLHTVQVSWPEKMKVNQRRILGSDKETQFNSGLVEVLIVPCKKMIPLWCSWTKLHSDPCVCLHWQLRHIPNPVLPLENKFKVNPAWLFLVFVTGRKGEAGGSGTEDSGMGLRKTLAAGCFIDLG